MRHYYFNHQVLGKENKVKITDAENPLPENSFNNPEYYDANEDNSKYDLTLVNAQSKVDSNSIQTTELQCT